MGIKLHIYIDSLKGKKLFFDFWKLPWTMDDDLNATVSIVNRKNFEREAKSNTLVMLEGRGKPHLCYLGNGMRLFVKIFPINSFPEQFKIIERIYDENEKTLSYILKDKERKIIYLPFFIDEVLENFYYERYIPTSKKTLFPRRILRLYYDLKPYIPRSLQVKSRLFLTQFQRNRAFPRWPLETSLEDFKRYILKLLLSVSKTRLLPFIWFWPKGKSFCTVLTHDVEKCLDGNDGIYRLIKVEKELGFKSSFFIVPFKYKVSEEKLEKLRNLGCEIGIHGYSHDGKLFSSWEIFQRRVEEINEKATEWGVEGFRSTSTYRNQEWFSLMDFSYDSSVPDTDPYEPQPGGCLSLFPFFIQNTVEIPITMPQDYTLFVLLQEKDIRIWRYKSAEIKRRNGLICVIAHPDEGYIGDKEKEKHYLEFLEFLSDLGDEGSMWNPLPRDLSNWWRMRTEARIVLKEKGVELEGLKEGCVKWAYLLDGELKLGDLPRLKEEVVYYEKIFKEGL